MMEGRRGGCGWSLQDCKGDEGKVALVFEAIVTIGLCKIQDTDISSNLSNHFDCVLKIIVSSDFQGIIYKKSCNR